MARRLLKGESNPNDTEPTMNAKIAALALVASLSTVACAAATDPTDATPPSEVGSTQQALGAATLGFAAPHQVAPDELQVPAMGFGYNTRTGQVGTVACYETTSNEVGPGRQGTVSFTSQMSTQSASSALSIDVDAKAHYGIYSWEGSFAMAREATSSSGSYTILLQASHLGKLVRGSTFALTPQAADLLARNRAAFLQSCGDEVINSVQYGSSLGVSYRVSFASDSQKQEMTASLGAKATFGELSTKLKSASASERKGISISITANQLGGDPSQLSRIIDATKAVTCSGDNLDACIGLAEKALAYASDTYPSQFTAGTGDVPVAFSSASGSSVAITDVSFGGVPSEVVQARGKLQSAFDQVVALKSLSSARAGSPAFDRAAVNKVQDAIDADNAAIQAAVPVCFDALETVDGATDPKVTACTSGARAALAKLHDPAALTKSLDAAARTFYGKSLAVAAVPGVCLDLYHGGLADYTSVGAYTCNQSNPQLWSFSIDGRIRNVMSTNACLDVEHSGVAEGTKVDIYSCDKTDQTWSIDEQGRLRGVTGMCVTVKAPTKDGEHLQATMQTCRDKDVPDAYQHFVVR